MAGIGRDWRELCAAASEESDPERLFSLINQILEAFDESDREMMRARISVTATSSPVVTP